MNGGIGGRQIEFDIEYRSLRTLLLSVANSIRYQPIPPFINK